MKKKRNSMFFIKIVDCKNKMSTSQSVESTQVNQEQSLEKTVILPKTMKKKSPIKKTAKKITKPRTKKEVESFSPTSEQSYEKESEVKNYAEKVNDPNFGIVFLDTDDFTKQREIYTKNSMYVVEKLEYYKKIHAALFEIGKRFADYKAKIDAHQYDNIQIQSIKKQEEKNNSIKDEQPDSLEKLPEKITGRRGRRPGVKDPNAPLTSKKVKKVKDPNAPPKVKKVRDPNALKKKKPTIKKIKIEENKPEQTSGGQ
jgi:hypothetical protein